MLGVEPASSLFGAKTTVCKQSERSGKIEKGFVSVISLNQNFFGNPRVSCFIGIGKEDMVADQLLNSARLDTKPACNLLNGQKGNSFTHGTMI